LSQIGKTAGFNHPWPNLTDHPKPEQSDHHKKRPPNPLLNPEFELGAKEQENKLINN